MECVPEAGFAKIKICVLVELAPSVVVLIDVILTELKVQAMVLAVEPALKTETTSAGCVPAPMV
jgi:hypothetical protein